MKNITTNQGKTNAMISHFWILGTLIAFVLNMNSKNSFTSFYIRQMIGLHVLSAINGFVIYKYLGNFAGWIVGLVLFVLWLISFMATFNGEKKLVPFIGEQFQDWFKGI